MAALTGQSPSATYTQLLRVEEGVDGTLRPVVDGAGTATALSVSTAGISVDGVITGDGSGLTNVGGDLPTGNTLWVDALHGDDGTALPDRADLPYLTLAAAKAAASAGDLVVVRPGTYNERNLLKNGVNWHFELGAVVDYTGTGDGAIFDDSSYGANAAVVCTVSGRGQFKWRGTSASRFTDDQVALTPHNAVSVTNPGSVVTVEGDLLYARWAQTGDNLVACARQTAGQLTLRFREILGEATAGRVSALWWTNGDLYAAAHRVAAPYSTLYFAYVFGSEVGDAYVTADLIEGLTGGVSPSGVILVQGSPDPDFKTWVDAKEIRCPVSLTTGRNYIRAEKLSSGASSDPPLTITNGENWVTLQKLTVGTAGCPVGAADGHSEIEVLEVENTGSASYLFDLSSNVRLRVWRMTLAAGTTAGVRANSPGTNVVFGGHVDASAATAGNPVVALASGLALRDAVLAAATGRDAVTAASAVTVAVQGALTANAGLHANVTRTGGPLVRSDTGSLTAAGAVTTTGAFTARNAAGTATTFATSDTGVATIVRPSTGPVVTDSPTMDGTRHGTIFRYRRSAGETVDWFIDDGDSFRIANLNRVDANIVAGATVTASTSLRGNTLSQATDPNWGPTIRPAVFQGVTDAQYGYQVRQFSAAQSANLTEWANSTGATVYSTVSENGYFTTRKTAAPADAELAAGEVAFWFDATAGAAKVMFKAKDSGGTVRTGQVTLS